MSRPPIVSNIVDAKQILNKDLTFKFTRNTDLAQNQPILKNIGIGKSPLTIFQSGMTSTPKIIIKKIAARKCCPKSYITRKPSSHTPDTSPARPERSYPHSSHKFPASGWPTNRSRFHRLSHTAGNIAADEDHHQPINAPYLIGVKTSGA